MKRHHSRRRWQAKPPPGLRPKLDRSQVTRLALAHHENVAAIARGDGTPEILQDHQHAAMSWLLATRELAAAGGSERFAEAISVLEAAIVACGDMAERYRRCGRVGFTGPEHQVAVTAADWMDAVAEVVDRDTARRAVLASTSMLGARARQGLAP